MQTIWNYIEEWEMSIEKNVLVKKQKNYKWTKRGFITTCLSWKMVHGVEKQWDSGKEKVQGAVVSKGDHADSVLGHEKTRHY